ncbi:MAG: hypothetical protein HOW73_25325 [Polyangiaceae bacterium]|nr:hypothetical protein [Polyangiaceae bacterium]
MSGFDVQDLRFRVQSSFSLPELRRLLVGWGADPEETAGDTSTLARAVVKLGMQRFGANELIHKLKAEKPLTEWPDPTEGDDERWAPRSGPISTAAVDDVGEATVVDNPPVMLEPPGIATLVGLSPADDVFTKATVVPPPQPAPIAATLVDAPLPPPPAAPTLLDAPRPPPPVELPPPSVKPASTRVAPPSNPLVFLEPEMLRRRQERETRRWLVLGIAGGVVALLAIAFGAGMLLRRDDMTASNELSRSGSPRTDGPAGRAANVLDESLRRVADACALDVDGNPTRSIFALSQEACGRDEADRLARAEQRERERALYGNDAVDPNRFAPVPPVPDEDRLPPTARPTADKRAKPPADTTPRAQPEPKLQPGGGNCMTKCQKTRGECDRSCGPEPKDASLYDAYMNCSGRCVSAESKCRRGCL